MTPQEQQLIANLFERLASLENQRRDPDAEWLIREGLRRAPNAVYALVQTALVQDEALKRANARIEELQRASAAPAEGAGGGFLDNMRNMVGGGRDVRGSVPPVQPPGGGLGSSGAWGRPAPAGGGAPGYPQGAPQGYPPGYPQSPPQAGGGYPPPPPAGYPPQAGFPQASRGGGSFLGTAAATVAGVVGGGMLLNSIRGMLGSHESHAEAHASDGGGGQNSSGSLAQDAGMGDLGGGGSRTAVHGNTNNMDNNDSGGFLGGSVDDLLGGDNTRTHGNPDAGSDDDNGSFLGGGADDLFGNGGNDRNDDNDDTGDFDGGGDYDNA